TLLDEEQNSWMSELDWDYSSVRRILASFIQQDLLPGYVAGNTNRAFGYTYFLIHQDKGIIGTLYASRPECSQEIAYEILALAVNSLKDAKQIRRIEAQIIPFNDLNLTPGFTQHGFHYFPRFYLELDLSGYTAKPAALTPPDRIVKWDSSY